MNEPSLIFQNLDDIRCREMDDTIGLYIHPPKNLIIVDILKIFVDSILKSSKRDPIDFCDQEYFTKKFANVVSHELIHFILLREFNEDVTTKFDNIAYKLEEDQ